MTALAVSAVLLVAFLKLEQRAAKPLFPPHIWKLQALVSGTAVMLGVTGILVGTVFLTSIFLQTVLGFSALETGLAFLPFALAITAGTLVARHLLAHLSPRVIATVGLLVTVAASLWLSTADGGAHFATDILPGLSVLGLGVGMVFVPVSVTSMAGIPASHAGVASGFLMTGHEIGAALGVAVLSAVASRAGTLTTADRRGRRVLRRVHRRRRDGCRRSRSSRCSGCPPPASPAAAATCTCTEPHAMSGLGTGVRDYTQSCAGASIAEGLAVQGETVKPAGDEVERWGNSVRRPRLRRGDGHAGDLRRSMGGRRSRRNEASAWDLVRVS